MLKNHNKWTLALVVAGLLGATACGTDDTASTQQNSDANNNVVVLEDMSGNNENNQSMPDMGGDVDMGEEPEDMGSSEEDMASENNQSMPDMGEEVDMAPTPCMANGDCTAPQICTVTADGESLCQDPQGTGEAGDSCAMASDCRSGLCLNGACANPCVTAADCPNGFECNEMMVPVEGGRTVALNVCVEAPKVCQSDADCDDPQICVIDRSGMSAELLCQDPVPGTGELGEDCAMDSECVSGLCLEDKCSRPCERPNDCSTDGSFICEPTQVTTGSGATVSVNVCKPKPPTQCLSDSECVAPERCVAQRGTREVEFVCGAPNAGGVEVGGDCTQDSECAQNLCLEGKCASPCQGNGDCSSAPDYTCELREVELDANNRDNVQVCVPPVMCQDAGECKITEECFVRRVSQGVETLCREGNIGGGTVGQVCTQDSECAANLCYEGRFDSVCSVPCTDDTDCNVPGYECRLTGVASSTGATVDLKICAPKDPPTCTSNDDCQTGTTCAIVPNEAGTALESVCIPSTGKLATGVACSGDDDCAGRVCLNGSCAAPCTDTNQCGVSQICASNTVAKAGLAGSFDVCERLTDQVCTSTSSCTDGVRVCSDLRNTAQGVEAYCRFPIENGAQLGTSCTNSSECREALCLPTSNECSVVCAADTDCSAANNQICSSFQLSQTDSVNMCVRSCTDNASCTNGNICTINPDVPNNDVDQVCEAPIGAKELGDLCAAGSECRTGLCLTTYLYNGISCTSDAQCTGTETCECPIDDPNCVTGKQCADVNNRCSRICDDNADCAGGIVGNPLTACSTDVRVTLPDGMGTKLLSFCGEQP